MTTPLTLLFFSMLWLFLLLIGIIIRFDVHGAIDWLQAVYLVGALTTTVFFMPRPCRTLAFQLPSPQPWYLSSSLSLMMPVCLRCHSRKATTSSGVQVFEFHTCTCGLFLLGVDILSVVLLAALLGAEDYAAGEDRLPLRFLVLVWLFSSVSQFPACLCAEGLVPVLSLKCCPSFSNKPD